MSDGGEESDGEAPDRLGALREAAASAAEGALMTSLPFGREIGMRLHSAENSVAVVSVPYDERLVGDPETDVLHGGVITALLDTACGWSVMAAPVKLMATATLDLRIDYMRPATAGETVYARAECYRLTRSIGFARAVAHHGNPDDPVATAQGAFILDRAPEKDAAP